MNAGPCAGFLFRSGPGRRDGENVRERERERRQREERREKERACLRVEEHGLGSAMWDI